MTDWMPGDWIYTDLHDVDMTEEEYTEIGEYDEAANEGNGD